MALAAAEPSNSSGFKQAKIKELIWLCTSEDETIEEEMSILKVRQPQVTNTKSHEVDWFWKSNFNWSDDIEAEVTKKETFVEALVASLLVN